MYKTKTKANEMTLVEDNVDPKVRMKEVRIIVAKAIKNGRRIDLLGFKGNDIARSQIALQDLLDRERTRHAKARNHIIEYQNAFESMSMMIDIMTKDAMCRQMDDSEAKIRMGSELHATSQQNALLHKENMELAQALNQTTADLEDTMNTLRVVLTGSINNG